MTIEHFDNLEKLHKYLKWDAPLHSMISVVALKDLVELKEQRESSPPISTDFYTIGLKEINHGTFSYGRTQYDFSNGCLTCYSPNQILSWEKIELLPKGYIITFHKDYILGTNLEEKIQQYNFFNYNINEALHLSKKEEESLLKIFEFAISEYQNNQDEFSKEIIISHIETILKYAHRFYKRQFLNREIVNTKLSENFRKVLMQYFNDGKFILHGSPTVHYIADQLNVSARYLSDMLKVQTGKTAINHIHLYLIEESKNMLLKPSNTVSNVAFDLGFSSPQYFTKLFKQKVGITPKEYQKSKVAL